jgi:hypothetical protein
MPIAVAEAQEPVIEEQEIEPRVYPPRRRKPRFPIICAPCEPLLAAFEIDHCFDVISAISSCA